MDKPYFYVILLVSSLLLIQILTVYFSKDGFSRRCKVAAEFDNALHRTLYVCDYGNLEKPEFLEMQEKSKKFLYSNWHGFGYLLDCALGIICSHAHRTMCNNIYIEYLDHLIFPCTLRGRSIL